jgi:hypothetical protein
VSFARGDVVVYKPVLQREGRSNLRLIVSANAVNSDDELPTVVALHVLGEDPGGLLAVRIGEHGWAFAMELDRPLRSRLTQKIGEASLKRWKRSIEHYAHCSSSKPRRSSTTSSASPEQSPKKHRCRPAGSLDDVEQEPPGPGSWSQTWRGKSR